MTVRYSTGCLTNLLGESGVDAGANGLKGIFKDGVIEIYSGAQPANADNAATGTMLAQVTLDAGAFTDGIATNGLEFGAPVGKVLSKAVAENWKYLGLVAAGTGVTAGWFRLRGNAADSGLSTVLPRIDGSIGTSASDMVLSNVVVVENAPGTVDTFNITLS